MGPIWFAEIYLIGTYSQECQITILCGTPNSTKSKNILACFIMEITGATNSNVTLLMHTLELIMRFISAWQLEREREREQRQLHVDIVYDGMSDKYGYRWKVEINYEVKSRNKLRGSCENHNAKKKKYYMPMISDFITFISKFCIINNINTYN